MQKLATQFTKRNTKSGQTRPGKSQNKQVISKMKIHSLTRDLGDINLNKQHSTFYPKKATIMIKD